MKPIVTDGQLGQLAVKQHELFERTKRGVYASFDAMLAALQSVIEGTTPIVPVLAVVEKLDSILADVFRLTVDYGQSLEQMIAAGHYNWTNSDITAKRFPIEGKGIVEFEGRYFNFDSNVSSEIAVKSIEQADTANPWMPAKIEHTLSHGAAFPKEQRKFPIVGLGSVAKVDGRRYVPCLGRDDSGRGLDLRWWGGDWDPRCRFLAVRKVSVS